ncbi:Restriction endonuclease, type I, EcoRI, R subunit/Type III [Caldithrix abyssi DSM 13497]|uniref:Restriction endonuclease, type I, EcoRI, R subunit/Type III n=1 Tax=Caldithrix abyssi DSM 13497 TaxID=880073 RepID=H1XYK6_CALAY|nr:type I restriction endonuclease subunit R [Caldithrix abyssi]APF19712.1 type I restriction enzyme, R subunit [Caldithrix abyssi DSM 13497]EHO39824.1 Restriction endonuclease, type I, EcoRI, R subunit/Type III [Caldithrix abyssi DSM 13497]
MTTDTSERGLERLICTALTGSPCEPGRSGSLVAEPVAPYGGAGYFCGDPEDYDREYCIDLFQLTVFLKDTQPEIASELDLNNASPTRRKFLARLQGEISRRGMVDVLRQGIKHGPYQITLFYGAPSPGNAMAQELYQKNRFSITRQLRYSRDETQRALDLVLFINGLPVFTFELKNRLTKQTVHDAIEQYKRDRNPREKLFEFGRCVAHFAVDEEEVWFCTHLKGKASWFLPFNQGWNGGAGNPPNPQGIKTDYLWKRILKKDSLTNILENYAQIVEERDAQNKRKKRKQIFPRYHQLDVVRKLLAHAAQHGAGHRYLIQHSAGSGKSNSIAWLAHQLIGLQQDGQPVFDSIIVVTDRRVLDRQIRDTIKQFAQVSATVGHAERSGDLRKFIESGKKIIISTVQKFPFILDEIGNEHRGRRFAIIIDEAHSSQGGKTSAAMSTALSAAGAEEEEETIEDQINRLIEAKKLLPNASYFAFTATPKNKTLELFGEPEPQDDGTVKHRPFHIYTMKQAIQEGFILDVLAHYTPVKSYYKLVKKIEDDPEFDVRKAQKKLRRFVESHEHAIRLKAEIMIDHFHEQVVAKGKIGGKARAMVVTSGVQRAIQYFHAFQAYLKERNSPYQAIVAFSGEHDYGGKRVTEASLNGFPSNQIPEKIREEPYRFLICADKFQTGYDEPLLHTMYVDKVLSGVKAVQTLSRLNRAHPQKHDTFVLDFMNDADTIREAFEPYYRTTILAEQTDPDKLHDLKSVLDGYQVYSQQQIDYFVELYLGGADCDKLDPILDRCVLEYAELDEDGQVDFKGKAKAFLRTYNFLAAVLPYSNVEWEKLSIFLNFLVPKLPAPQEEDLSKGILEAIDMDSYRVEKQRTMKIALADEDAEIEPVPAAGGGHKAEPELDRLSNIIRQFNDQFGNIEWTDADRVHKLITEEIPAKVAADPAYQNARKHSDKQNARIEHDKALQRVMMALLQDDTELFKQFSDNESFRRWLADMVFALTYSEPGNLR